MLYAHRSCVAITKIIAHRGGLTATKSPSIDATCCTPSMIPTLTQIFCHMTVRQEIAFMSVYVHGQSFPNLLRLPFIHVCVKMRTLPYRYQPCLTSHVSLPLIPSLSSFCAVLKPGMPFSTMKAVMPFGPASGAVLAYTTRVLACV